MASFWDRINPIGSKSWVNPIANKSFRGAAVNLFKGTPEKRENVSTLRPEQEGLFNQLTSAGQQGPGGAFGQAQNYYQGLLNGQDYDTLAAPALRQYNEDIVPGLSEQFAGMGSGGLSSSGFRNAQIQGATDLSERLGALRANLRQSGAQGLQNIGAMGLQPYAQNMTTRAGSQGLLAQAAPLIGAGIGFAAGGPGGAAAGYGAGSWLSGNGNSTGANTGAYQGGNNVPASPQINNPYAQQGGFQLPKFGQRSGY